MSDFDEYLEYLEQDYEDEDSLFEAGFDQFLESEESGSDYGDYLGAVAKLPAAVSIDETHRQMALDVLTGMTPTEIQRMVLSFIENEKQNFSYVALPQDLHLTSV